MAFWLGFVVQFGQQIGGVVRSLLILIWFVFSVGVFANEYKLGSGDNIEIAVYGEPDLTTKVKINKSGMISFPFIEDFNVVGLTVDQVEEVVRNGLLGDYLINPQVIVTITEYRPFFIHGQVKRPGGYPFQDQLTLDKAIALAGGLTIRASQSDWNITRIKDGKTIVLEANVATRVQPDDIIKIEQSFF